jgi:hypothetical protein
MPIWKISDVRPMLSGDVYFDAENKLPHQSDPIKTVDIEEE